MYDLKHRWNNRTPVVASILEPNKSVLDIGCADKDFLNFYTPSDYIGLDITDKADVQIDLDKELYQPTRYFDYCLFLGVLEYLETFDKNINHYKKYADTTIILFSTKKTKKSFWKTSFSEKQKIELVEKHFDACSINEHNSFVIFICNKPRI